MSLGVIEGCHESDPATKDHALLECKAHIV